METNNMGLPRNHEQSADWWMGFNYGVSYQRDKDKEKIRALEDTLTKLIRDSRPRGGETILHWMAHLVASADAAKALLSKKET